MQSKDTRHRLTIVCSNDGVFRVAAAARLDQRPIWCTRGVFQRDHHGGNFGLAFGPTRQSGLGGDGGLLVAVAVRSFLLLN
jgi:hypothetical protein